MVIVAARLRATAATCASSSSEAIPMQPPVQSNQALARPAQRNPRAGPWMPTADPVYPRRRCSAVG
jgi:hypothetical protein